MNNVSEEIANIFEQNKLSDLKKFLRARHSLNCFNIVLAYLSPTVLTAGVLLSFIGQANKMDDLIYSGLGMSMLGTLIVHYEKINNSISSKALKDITLIREGNYVDEGLVIDVDDKSSGKSSSRPYSGMVPKSTTNNLEEILEV